MTRLLIAGILLTTLVAGLESGPETANAQVTPINLGSSGNIGTFLLDSSPVKCSYFSSGSLYDIRAQGALRVKARQTFSLPTQKVVGSIRLYQRLANNTYQFRSEAPIGSVTAGKVSYSNLGPGAITNVVTGPDWVLAHKITWYKTDNVTVDGWVIVAYPSYQRVKNNLNDGSPTSICGSPYLPPNVWLEHHPSNSYTGTVNSHVEYELHKFAIGVTVNVKFNGTTIDSVVTNADAEGIGDFVIPAKPKGTYPLEFKYGHWVANGSVTVVPRIKIIPSEDIARDQTVNVSLRGFKAGETVRIRWKKGTGWYQIAQVVTSSTGSKNIDVKVPKFVPNGDTSVRGDGNLGASAQTNAVSVFGGPFVASAVSTPTPTATATPSPTATFVPTEIPTIAPTETATPEPTSPPDASPVDIDSATATISPEA
jgi:hypothetical protein